MNEYLALTALLQADQKIEQLKNLITTQPAGGARKVA